MEGTWNHSQIQKDCQYWPFLIPCWHNSAHLMVSPWLNDFTASSVSFWLLVLPTGSNQTLSLRLHSLRLFCLFCDPSLIQRTSQSQSKVSFSSRSSDFANTSPSDISLLFYLEVYWLFQGSFPWVEFFKSLKLSWSCSTFYQLQLHM